MSDVQLLLLSPDGESRYATLPRDTQISRLSSQIMRAVGMSGDQDVTVRRDDGTIADPARSIAQNRIQSGDRLLIEPRRVTRSGFLGRLGRQTDDGETEVLPSAYRVLPCYLVVDTSRSMDGAPIAKINEELPRLQASMLREPELAEICQLAVITFDDVARVALPLADVGEMRAPKLDADGNGTNYATPFRLLTGVIGRDLYSLYRNGRRPYRPVVFFLSDGQHNRQDDWSVALRGLTDRRAFHGSPNIIAFGFGEATEQNIRTVGARAAYMPDEGAPSAQLDTFMTFLLSSLTNSVSGGRRDDDDVLVVPATAPKGWRALRIKT